MVDTCYMCDAEATGREHVPPRCFFPKAKDSPDGHDYRQNLVTVPSCDEHNQEKSKNDEYLAYTTLFHHMNNDVAAQQVWRKLKRAFDRNPNLKHLYNVQRPAYVNGKSTIAIQVDTERFNTGMAQIARGIWFHEHATRWTEPIAIHSPALLQPDNPDAAGLQASKLSLVELVRTEMQGKSCCGANPKVFRYHIIDAVDSHQLRLADMILYDGLEVVAMSHPSLKGADA